MPSIVCQIANLFFLVVFVRALLSWFPTTPGTFLAQVNHGLVSVTEPVLGPIRRAIGPLRIGNVGLDLSVIIVIIGGPILLRLVGC